MKQLILLTAIFLTGCASVYSPMDQYNNLSSTYKAKAVGLSSNNQLQVTSAWGIAAGSSPAQARLNALSICKNYNSSFRCVVEWENNKYVLNENLEALRKVKVKEYLIAKQEICKRYGFKATNAIAICVQKEMSNDRLYANSQNQQNVPRSSINYKAISELGAVFSEQAKNRAYTQNQAMKKTYFLKNNYMDGMNRVCVYDGWTETINGIGLCKLTIKR
jgi:hypothetical protein